MSSTVVIIVALLALAALIAAGIFLAGRRRTGPVTGTATFRIPTLSISLGDIPLPRECDGSFAFGGQVNVTYPVPPPGPAASVQLTIVVDDRLNIQPLRIAPDRFEITDGQNKILEFAVRGRLDDRCLLGRLLLAVEGLAPNTTPPTPLRRDVATPIDLPATGFRILQEPLVRIVSPRDGDFEVTFKLQCCGSGLTFVADIQNRIRIATAAFVTPVGATLTCSSGGAMEEFKISGRKEDPELDASFTIVVNEAGGRVCRLARVQIE